ncbi:MAG: phage portal protein [Solibacillus sp.]
MGLIKQLESVTSHKKVSLSESYYQKIIEWRELHRGYHEGIHKVKARNIEQGEHSRTLETMNMPKVVAQELAALIFNERCEISISEDGYNEFIQDVFKQDGFGGNFRQYLEFMFAQGGMAIKPYAEGGKIKLAYATADTFLPISWSNNRIDEGVFASEIKRQGKTYTHLEWHVKENGQYIVGNELYESTPVDIADYKTAYNRFKNAFELRTDDNVLSAGVSAGGLSTGIGQLITSNKLIQASDAPTLDDYPLNVTTQNFYNTNNAANYGYPVAGTTWTVRGNNAAFTKQLLFVLRSNEILVRG